MRLFLFTLALVFALTAAQAEVLRLAPDFTFAGVGKTQSLKSLRGQPVVLIIAKSPKTKEFKLQVKNLKTIYQQFANKQVIFVAAFTEESGLVVSDIPFVVANNGAAVANAYGVQNQPEVETGHGVRALVDRVADRVARVYNGPDKQGRFNIAIIGKDGNVDYQTSNVLGAERVLDVIQNSYAVQSVTGR
ncbi:MAG TPA: redoxin domain-containing protein [Bryobacteraceae bacterium]|jgi:peroxiredoxin